MRFACWISKAITHTHTHTHRIFDTYFFFHGKGLPKASQYSVYTYSAYLLKYYKFIITVKGVCVIRLLVAALSRALSFIRLVSLLGAELKIQGLSRK